MTLSITIHQLSLTEFCIFIVMLSIVKLNVVMLNFVKLNVVMVNAVMLSVMAPTIGATTFALVASSLRQLLTNNPA